ncbi:hypothetical protein BAUCODRAFT_405274 [Baudoinia panamericana UAMH 10762]|uniref:Dynactin subunit 6 n=1 Tax=Baudoinia panamericana (strain UAMH 10762) TaxID=717646 RepID=M2N1M1_BAUPA|nr:uncharacterized protein BAUCODRAFT_405274 [Baudoinia panamericana UAMH 10762]EMC97828.1 hypothetical protein BAUCODRAFT_405274 [Baudoinia panamericana UAMH 10762]
MTSKPSPAPTTREKRTPAEQPPVAKPPCDIHASAIIAEKAQITGTHPVEIAEDVVVHPYAKIRAENGSVSIGKGSMIWERAVVGCAEGSYACSVEIGMDVSIETGAIIEGAAIGDGTIVDVNAVVERGAVVGKWCRVAALERVKAGEKLEDFTVVFGDGRRRTDETIRNHEDVREARRDAQVKTVAVMRGLVADAKGKWL